MLSNGHVATTPRFAGPTLSSAAFKMTSIAMMNRIGICTAHGESNFQVDPVCGVIVIWEPNPETAEIAI